MHLEINLGGLNAELIFSIRECAVLRRIWSRGLVSRCGNFHRKKGGSVGEGQVERIRP